MDETRKMEIGVLAMLREGTNPFLPIAELGLKTAQLQSWNINLLTEETAKKTVKDLKESGIRLAGFWCGYSGRIVWNSYHGPETCGLVPRDLRERRVAELKRGAEFAKMIDAPALITHCGFIPECPCDPLYTETVNAIYDVAIYCHKLGIGFWFESGQETPLTLLRVIEDLGLPNLGVNLDTANLLLYGRGNPVDALEILGKHVRNLHVKDGLHPENSRVLGKEVPVGEGKADFDKIIKKLYDLNFTGELTIEREISGPQQTADILKAKAYLEELLKKHAPA
ncbi:MAG: sugar phosphate isomerase/epimerase [Lentisphaeria bacterium]|nr:sugar phosphate isomerase/epimerase [Lentisphaeria bacterium]